MPGIEINSVVEIDLDPKQLAWVLNLPWRDESQWTDDGMGSVFIESMKLRIQVAKVGSTFRISTWENSN